MDERELTIKCSKCGAKIRLTDAMAEQMVAPAVEAEKARQAEALAEERRHIRVEEEFKAKHVAERGAESTRIALNASMAAAEAEAARLRVTLAESQKEQARLLLQETNLKDREREIELTIARRVNAEASSIRQTAQRAADEAAALRLAEKDEQLRSLGGQIDELKRRAEHGDNRTAGEAQEVLLEALLKDKFRHDYITPVAKGVYGGDVRQQVEDSDGRAVGIILWESKRTKAWDDKWIGKLRTDQRAAGADLAVIVTQVMPKGSGTFDYVNGVWVVEWAHVYPAALVLRQSILEVAAVRVAQQGQATKAEALYTYLTGPRFKARMQAVVERLGEMGEDLRKERAATTRLWAKREEQIRGAVEAAASLVGDVQGVAGKAMGEIEALTLQIREPGGN
jgi:hypothetical protein